MSVEQTFNSIRRQNNLSEAVQWWCRRVWTKQTLISLHKPYARVSTEKTIIWLKSRLNAINIDLKRQCLNNHSDANQMPKQPVTTAETNTNPVLRRILHGSKFVAARSSFYWERYAWPSASSAPISNIDGASVFSHSLNIRSSLRSRITFLLS